MFHGPVVPLFASRSARGQACWITLINTRPTPLALVNRVSLPRVAGLFTTFVLTIGRNKIGNHTLRRSLRRFGRGIDLHCYEARNILGARPSITPTNVNGAYPTTSPLISTRLNLSFF